MRQSLVLTWLGIVVLRNMNEGVLRTGLSGKRWMRGVGVGERETLRVFS